MPHYTSTELATDSQVSSMSGFNTAKQKKPLKGKDSVMISSTTGAEAAHWRPEPLGDSEMAISTDTWVRSY